MGAASGSRMTQLSVSRRRRQVCGRIQREVEQRNNCIYMSLGAPNHQCTATIDRSSDEAMLTERLVERIRNVLERRCQDIFVSALATSKVSRIVDPFATPLSTAPLPSRRSAALSPPNSCQHVRDTGDSIHILNLLFRGCQTHLLRS